MADVSKITLPDSSEYNLKDATVRTALAGGAAGQILKKKSNGDFDVEWGTGSGAVSSVNGQTGDVQLAIPQIDDSSVSADGTWSSSKIRDFIYPVGSIYMSVNNTSPAIIFGGTWEQIQDRFLLAAGTSYAAGATGGEATHTLTVTEIPSHGHRLQFYNTSGSLSFGYNYGNKGALSGSDEQSSSGIAKAGGGQAHNNMPPYLAVYVWKRTA